MCPPFYFRTEQLIQQSQMAVFFASIFPPVFRDYAVYALWTLRMLFLWNIGSVVLLFFRGPDDFSDIALTPEQRKLFGLSPSTSRSLSADPKNFITPPRYTKSTPTSRAASPLPGNTSPTTQRKAALNSSQGTGLGGYVPDTPSPLGSPLRPGGGGKLLWGSPRSPSSGGGSSITPSNRWAYERGVLSRKGS